MHNKRGQGLSTNAIILIVLGIVVLAVLVIGFTLGWDKIAPWISTSNVDTIKTQCDVACSTGSTYDYCTVNRTLKAGEVISNDKKSAEGTCYAFSHSTNSDIYSKYGIEECPSITCPADSSIIITLK